MQTTNEIKSFSCFIDQTYSFPQHLPQKYDLQIKLKYSKRNDFSNIKNIFKFKPLCTIKYAQHKFFKEKTVCNTISVQQKSFAKKTFPKKIKYVK